MKLHSGMRVRSRHHLLQMTIGTFPEENETYTLLTTLMFVLPIGLVTASLLEWGLFILYNYKLHPWREILKSDQSDDYSGDSIVTEDIVSVRSIEHSEILKNVNTEDVHTEHITSIFVDTEEDDSTSFVQIVAKKAPELEIVIFTESNLT